MQVGSAQLRGAKDGRRARTNCPSTLSTVHTVLAATIIIAFLSCLYYSTRHNMTSTRGNVEKHKFCSDGSTWRCEVSHFCAQILEKRLWVHFRPVFLRSLKGQTAPAAAASDHGTRVLTTCHQLNCMYTKPLLKDYKIFIRAFTLYMAPL